MIVVVNAGAVADAAAVAARLAPRLGLPPRDVRPVAIGTASELRALRRELARTDPTVYAFRLRGGPEAWRREERIGDVGFPVDAADPDDAAREIAASIREPVVLAPPDPEWPAAFGRELARLEEALGDAAVAVHHVGSTAVPGLPAKPILDLAVETRDAGAPPARFVESLLAIDYRFLDYPTNVDRWFFARGRPRTHHVHAFPAGHAGLADLLAFRDALRADAALRRRYADLKRRLAAAHGDARARYGEEKGEFVRAVLARVGARR